MPDARPFNEILTACLSGRLIARVVDRWNRHSSRVPTLMNSSRRKFWECPGFSSPFDYIFRFHGADARRDFLTNQSNKLHLKLTILSRAISAAKIVISNSWTVSKNSIRRRRILLPIVRVRRDTNNVSLITFVLFIKTRIVYKAQCYVIISDDWTKSMRSNLSVFEFTSKHCFPSRSFCETFEVISLRFEYIWKYRRRYYTAKKKNSNKLILTSD